jgi:hypothetical protein
LAKNHEVGKEMIITGNSAELQNNVHIQIEKLGPLLTDKEVEFYQYSKTTVGVKNGQLVEQTSDILMNYVAGFVFSSFPLYIVGAIHPVVDKGEVIFHKTNDMNVIMVSVVSLIMRLFPERSLDHQTDMISYLINELKESIYEFNPPIKEYMGE